MARPDDALLTPCRIPLLAGPTYRDVVILALDRERALEDCNDQLKAIRDAYRRTETPR